MSASVILSVVYHLWTASSLPQLIGDLEHLLKVRYIILVMPNVPGFLNSNTVFSWKHCHMCENNITNMNSNFCLVRHIASPNFHRLCLVNTHILVYWYARCDWKLWKATWFYLGIFLGIFIHYWQHIHIWSVLSSPNCHRI